MHNSCISPQSINSPQQNTCQAKSQSNTVVCKNTTQRQELSYKIRCQRLRHVTQTKDEKPNTKQWHCSCGSTQVFQCFCMCTIILRSYTLKLSRTPDPVSLHSKNRTKDSYLIQSEQRQNNHTHMSYTTISNKFFLINLAQCCLRCVNNAKQTNSANPRSQISTRFRKLVQIKTLQTIGTQLLQYSRQQNTSSSAPFYMSLRQPQMQRHLWYLNSKCQEKSPPKQQLSTRMNRKAPQQQIIGCTGPTIQLQQARKHCQAPYESIKNLQICSTYFSCTTSPQPDLQEHRLKSTFIKYIKTKQINTRKTPKLKTFQCLQQSIKSLTMFILSIPTTLNCLWHLNCSQHDHPKTQTILAKLQLYCKQSIPTCTQTNNLLKGLNCSWYKTRPLSHALYQCDQTEKQGIITMRFAFFAWLQAKKQSCSQRQQQNCCQKSFHRNRLYQHCSQYTQTNNQRPHYTKINEKVSTKFQILFVIIRFNKSKVQILMIKIESAADRFELSL